MCLAKHQSLPNISVIFGFMLFALCCISTQAEDNIEFKEPNNTTSSFTAQQYQHHYKPLSFNITLSPVRYIISNKEYVTRRRSPEENLIKPSTTNNSHSELTQQNRYTTHELQNNTTPSLGNNSIDSIVELKSPELLSDSPNETLEEHPSQKSEQPSNFTQIFHTINQITINSRTYSSIIIPANSETNKFISKDPTDNMISYGQSTVAKNSQPSFLASRKNSYNFHNSTNNTTQDRNNSYPLNLFDTLTEHLLALPKPSTNSNLGKLNFQKSDDRLEKPASSIPPGEKSQRMCEEYSELSLNLECKFMNPLIVNGKNASSGEFPHMAALGFRKNEKYIWECGASLISNQFLLTAAHCTDSQWGPPVLARLGILYLSQTQHIDIPISTISRHPDFKPPSRYNDIALIRLESTVKFSATIRPACLGIIPPSPDQMALATGWGRTKPDSKKSDRLLKVMLPIMDSEKCNKFYHQGPRLRRGLTPSLLCAGKHERSEDTCQGDSGGPLQIMNGRNPCIYHLVGITSFGKECGIGVPAVYTRVASYISWIESKVWP